MRVDRIVVAALGVLVSTAIVAFSTGNTGASFTGTTTNPGQILNTVSVQPPATQNAVVSVSAGTVNLSWTATPTPPNGHTITYLVLRNGTQIGTTGSLAYSDTPPADGTYSYTIQTKIAQGAGFFTSGNSAAQNGISDRTAPTASITCAGGVCGAGWYTAVPTVVITGADGGSGVSTVTRNIDAAGNVAGASPLTIPALGQGTHTVAYFATDVAGNSNGAVTSTIKVDSVAPTAVTGLGAATGANGPPVTVDLTWTAGTDATSGIAGYVVHWSNAVATCAGATYPNSATIGVVTSYQITGLATNQSYCAYVVTKDNAGNLSANSAVVGPTSAK
jgi:hypothetical protein